MQTYVNLKTNSRYPKSGVASWFRDREFIIKAGYPDCTNGWKKKGARFEKNWKQEEIPDLAEPFSREQWIEYANKYGVFVAQQFLDCCDYMKPTKAYRMFNPPKNEKTFENNAVWFKSVFGIEIWDFACGYSLAFGNKYSLDVLKFEKFLSRNHGYNENSDVSMSDFITEKFGLEASDKIKSLI